MSFSRNVPAGLIPKGLQRIVMNSTATLLNTTCGVGSAFIISVETSNVRVVFDGSTPTSNTGVLLNAGDAYFLEGIADADTKLKFARAAAGTILNVAAFGRPSDKVAAP